MRFIETTAIQFEHMRLTAHKISRRTGTRYSAALDAVAVKHGYENWKHVSECRARPVVHAVAPEALLAALDSRARGLSSAALHGYSVDFGHMAVRYFLRGMELCGEAITQESLEAHVATQGRGLLTCGSLDDDTRAGLDCIASYSASQFRSKIEWTLAAIAESMRRLAPAKS